VANAGLGFVFWFLAAKLSPSEDLGVAIGMISSLMLLIIITRFGLDNSLIRFFPERDKARVFGTSLSITTISIVISVFIFVGGIGLFSPSLSILTSPADFLLFLAFTVAGSVFWQVGSALLAVRKANLYLLQNILNGSKIILLFPLIALGTIGIFTAYGIALIVSTVIFFLVVVKLGIRINLSIDTAFLRQSFSFSSSNYFAQLFIWAPTSLLSIIVLNSLGGSDAAYYYIAYTIAAIIYMIPTAVSTSLFVEGSHGQDMMIGTLRSYKVTFAVLTPLTILLIIFGDLVLGIFGDQYPIMALDLLRIMLLSSFFVAIVQIGMSIMRVKNANRDIVVLSGWIFFSLIASSIILTSIVGLNGIGYAWLISYGTGSLLSAILLRKKSGNMSDKIKNPIGV